MDLQKFKCCDELQILLICHNFYRQQVTRCPEALEKSNAQFLNRSNAARCADTATGQVMFRSRPPTSWSRATATPTTKLEFQTDSSLLLSATPSLAPCENSLQIAAERLPSPAATDAVNLQSSNLRTPQAFFGPSSLKQEAYRRSSDRNVYRLEPSVALRLLSITLGQPFLSLQFSNAHPRRR